MVVEVVEVVEVAEVVEVVENEMMSSVVEVTVVVEERSVPSREVFGEVDESSTELPHPEIRRKM